MCPSGHQISQERNLRAEKLSRVFASLWGNGIKIGICSDTNWYPECSSDGDHLELAANATGVRAGPAPKNLSSLQTPATPGESHSTCTSTQLAINLRVPMIPSVQCLTRMIHRTAQHLLLFYCRRSQMKRET